MLCCDMRVLLLRIPCRENGRNAQILIRFACLGMMFRYAYLYSVVVSYFIVIYSRSYSSTKMYVGPGNGERGDPGQSH